MSKTKHSLTAENLRKLEHQFEDEDKRSKDLSRTRIPERTAGDGRSSSKHSYGSQLTAFKRSLNKSSQPRQSAENHTRKQRSDQWFQRPDREAFRKNPEGRSRNPSVQATPNIVRIDYNDDDDYRINYEEQDEDEGDNGSADPPAEEESDDESSRLPSDEEVPERTKPKKDDTSSDGTPLTRSSSPMLSEDESEEDESEEAAEDEDEDDEEEEGGEEETDEAMASLDPDVREAIQATEAREQSKPSTPTSARSSSSVNASTSSIPTAAASPTSRTSSRRTKTPAASSVASSAPSYVLNKNAYRLQKVRDKMEKDRAGAESSIMLSRQNSFSELSARERGTTTATPNRGASVIRNWSRWTRHSDAGYSISEGSVDKRRNKKTQKQKNSEVISPSPKKQNSKESPGFSTTNSRTSSRARSGLTSVLQISRIKSEPDVRRSAAKRQVKLTADPQFSRSRSTSQKADEATSRADNPAASSRRAEGTASRVSNRAASSRSIMKRASTSRAKSDPNLKKYADAHNKVKNKSKPGGVSKHGQKPPLAPRPSTRNKAGKTDNDLDDVHDFSNRKKKIPKKKERPTRKGAGSVISNASSTWTVRTKNKSFAARSAINASSSMSLMSSNKSDVSRSRTNLSSAATILSRKNFPPLLNSESGFYSDRGLASSAGSLRAPETPFSSRGGRTTGMRSAITQYSSGPSRARSSAKSSLFLSDETLSSQSGKVAVMVIETGSSNNGGNIDPFTVERASWVIGANMAKIRQSYKNVSSPY